MEYIESKSTDPRWNLALEQFLFDTTERSRSFFMLWQNDNTIVAGKNQNIAAEVNADFVRSQGITVVRRLSGGGTVYHDLGNLNFTFIMDSGALEKINFQLFCRPIIDTLASFGVKAELSGRNDITIAGKKFSGNAQYLRDGRVMHHGTLMFSSDLTVLERALAVDREKLRSKGVKSVSSRVTNLKEHLPQSVTLSAFKERLLQHIARSEPLIPYTLSAADEATVAEIKRSRYDTWEWTYGQSPAHEMSFRRRIDGVGLVEASASVKGGCFSALSFSGDFFGSGEADELAGKLVGCTCERSAVVAALQGVDVGHYIHNLTSESLAELLVP